MSRLMRSKPGNASEGPRITCGGSLFQLSFLNPSQLVPGAVSQDQSVP